MPSRCISRRWSASGGNDNLGGVAWKAAAIHDKDGSVGGIPNSYILLNDGPNDQIATDAQACEIKPRLERCGVQGRCGALEFWRRVVVVAPRELLVPVRVALAPVSVALALAQPPLLLAQPRVPVLLPREPELLFRLQSHRELVPLQRLNRQSFSAAMAGTTASTRATYEPVPRSR